MNERIRELAEQCWDRRLDGVHFNQEMFAELVAADEREAIAAWLDGEAGSGRIISCISAAKAIRARGQE
jgi:hypothetical protein